MRISRVSRGIEAVVEHRAMGLEGGRGWEGEQKCRSWRRVR